MSRANQTLSYSWCFAILCQTRELLTAENWAWRHTQTNLCLNHGMLKPWQPKRNALFWVVTQQVVVISYLHFGTNYWFHLQGSRFQTTHGNRSLTHSLTHTRVFVLRKKCTLVQALRLCTDRTAHRGSRRKALLFLDHGTRRGWGIRFTPRILCRYRLTFGAGIIFFLI